MTPLEMAQAMVDLADYENTDMEVLAREVLRLHGIAESYRRAEAARQDAMPIEIAHVVALAESFLAGGDSPPFRADTTVKLARAVIKLARDSVKP